MDITNIIDRFPYVYSYLYDSHDLEDVAGDAGKAIYRALMSFGDDYLRRYPETTRQLVSLKRDGFTSDREVAALALALFPISDLFVAGK